MKTSLIREDAVLRAMRRICEKVNTPRSLGIYLCLQYNDHRSIAELQIDPRMYLTPESFRKDYFVTNFLAKYKGLDTGIDLEKTALTAWISSESKCAETNKRIKSGLRESNSRVHSILFRAQRKISQILGPLKISDTLRKCRWSSGATYDLRRGATLAERISHGVSVTRSASKYLRICIETDPHWFEAVTGLYPEGPVSLLPSAIEIVEGNRFLTVPKSSKTHRCISAEPTGNAFLQQGVHAYMRDRLSRFGIDLTNQTANAQAASLCEKLGWATIDLSSASDTISDELVHHLLPIDWYLYLNDLRSRKSRVSGKWVTLQKFSSMGNAFTFELETLIFYALTKSVEEELGVESLFQTPFVYGDDIVTFKECKDLLLEVFADVGFTINQSKSFFDGSFYESCGKHYFQGEDVTPKFQKETSETREELIRLHNRIYRFSSQWACHWDSVCMGIIKTYQHFGDKHVPRIPASNTDDGGFVSASSLLGRYDSNHGFRCVVYHNVPLIERAKRTISYFAYKLREPTFSFSDRLGQEGLASTRLRYRYGITYRHDWGDAQGT